MSVYRFVELDRFPAVEVSEALDTRTGIVQYTVQGSRVSGCVTFHPRILKETETLPTHVFAYSGAQAGDPLTLRREQRLTIDGLEIQVVDVFRADKEPVDPAIFRELVRSGRVPSERDLPRITYRHARAIVDALVGTWMRRDDVVDLLHMSALSVASTRLHQERANVANLQAVINELNQDITASEELAGFFAAQASEYEFIITSELDPNSSAR